MKKGIKKELLRHISMILLTSITLLMISVNSSCGEDRNDWLNELASKPKEQAFKAIAKVYAELQRIQTNTAKVNQASNFDLIDTNPTDQESLKLDSAARLRVFVSSSMNINLLKNYAQEAKKYNAILVFKGLPEGSWLKLANLVQDISDGETLAMQIDDEAFKEFDVKSVPAIILSETIDEFNSLIETTSSDRALFDKATGNIGIRGALRLFAESGDLSKSAKQILDDS